MVGARSSTSGAPIERAVGSTHPDVPPQSPESPFELGWLVRDLDDPEGSPSFSCRRTTADWGPSTSSSSVRWLSSKKKTVPPGSSASSTRFQKDAKLSSGTCEIQKPKNTASYRRPGRHENRSACTKRTRASSPHRARAARQHLGGAIDRRHGHGRPSKNTRPHPRPARELEYMASRPKGLDGRQQLDVAGSVDLVVFVLVSDGPVVGELLVTSPRRARHGRRPSPRNGARLRCPPNEAHSRGG